MVSHNDIKMYALIVSQHYYTVSKLLVVGVTIKTTVIPQLQRDNFQKSYILKFLLVLAFVSTRNQQPFNRE